VGRRLISVSEDVYRRLSRLAVERNLTLSDLIRELLDNYERGVCRDSMIEVLDDVRAMLRECLSKLGVDVKQLAKSKPIESKPEQTETVPKSEVVNGFEDNPWVQILRTKSRG
jgi:Ribbon-helix-helix protein, copG family.